MSDPLSTVLELRRDGSVTVMDAMKIYEKFKEIDEDGCIPLKIREIYRSKQQDTTNRSHQNSFKVERQRQSRRVVKIPIEKRKTQTFAALPS